MNNRSGMDKTTVAAVVAGAGVGIIAVLASYFAVRRERNRVQREMSVLRRDVMTMKTELLTMKAVKSEEDKTDGRRRNRRRRRDLSGYDSESTMYTAQDSDDEFFDLSSDEDGLVTLSVEEDAVQRYFKEIDSMMNAHQSALEFMLTLIEELGSNVNFLWRLAKAYKLEYEACTGDKPEKLKILELGLTHARKAVELDSCNGDAHKWLAVLLGLKSDHLPVKEKLENGMLFYKHVNRAVDLKPEDHTLYYLLARFKFAIATLSWFERSAAKMIGELPEVTLDDAISDAKSCEDLGRPPMPENRILLAKAYFANNDTTSGLTWLQNAKEICPVDGEAYQELLQLIAKYQ